MGPTSVSLSESTKFGDNKSSAGFSQSGQHGNFFNLALGGHGNALSPTNTDSSGGLNKWVLLGAAVVGLLVFWMLKRKG